MKPDKQAQTRYRTALTYIERAQNLISDACEQLSPLVGAITEYELCQKHYDDTKNLWRRLAYSTARDDSEMDSDHQGGPDEA